MPTDLATRARDALRTLHEQGRIASPWLPGMRVLTQRLPLCSGTLTAYVARRRGYLDIAWDGGMHERCADPATVLPDPSAPATQGCLLALVREATGDPDLSAWSGPNGWGVGRWEARPRWAFTALVLPVCATEAEALVAALEAAAEVTRAE